MVYGITVKALKEMLAELPADADDYVVVLAKDEEGNGFETLSSMEIGWLRDKFEDEFRGGSPAYPGESWATVRLSVDRQYFRDEDTGEQVAQDEHDHRAICLWP